MRSKTTIKPQPESPAINQRRPPCSCAQVPTLEPHNMMKTSCAKLKETKKTQKPIKTKGFRGKIVKFKNVQTYDKKLTKHPTKTT